MNKERYNQIIDEAWKNYWEKVSFNKEEDCLVKQEEGSFLKEVRAFYQQEFINKIKTDKDFSDKWGLKIEERELTWEEQVQWVIKNTDVELENLYIVEEIAKSTTPTKLITLTYKEESIQFYE